MSLLRDIQNDLANANGDVVTVLLKCKILAARLGSEAFANWVRWELNGYPESQAIPEYRHLAVSYYASFMSVGWRVPKAPVPVFIIPEKYRDSFQVQKFHEGIAKAASLVKEGATIPRPELSLLLQGKMYPTMECQTVWAEISGLEFKQLVSAVNARILDFCLEIEAQNPDAGEAAPNSEPVPKERLQTIVNNFFGGVGNVAQQGRNFSQAANVGLTPQDLSVLVQGFTEHISELRLGAHERQQAEAQIATIKAQQLADPPNPVIIQQAGQTLRNITEGAIASLLATAAQPTVWHGIQLLLGHLPR
jgi:hypothetical protein